MTKFQIYAWGNGKEIAPFDVSSNILNYLINQKKNTFSDSFEIIPNSDFYNSYSGKLPYIQLSNDTQVEGFIEIWKFMNKNNHQNNNSDPKLQILHTAYMNNLIENLNVITLYNFFIVKKNYENYTRGSFKDYLPWPTQYKPPLDFRSMAQELTLNAGIIDNELMIFNEDEIDELEELKTLKKEEKNLRDTPVINDIQKAQIEKQLDIISQKKYIISNMQCIKKLKEILKDFDEIKTTLTENIFEIILLIYLKCNISEKLPENFIYTWLKREQPALLDKISQLDSGSFNVIHVVDKIPLTTALYSYITQAL